MKSAFRYFAASLSLSTLTALAMAACSAAAPNGSTSVDNGPQTEHRITVDATAIGALPSGQSYIVDLGRADTTYVFEYAAAPIDFSRVTVRFASGHDVSMSDWLAKTAIDGQDDVTQNPGHFEIRPAQSDDPRPDLVTGTGGTCVTLCGWVCKTEHGPCTWKCITNCP